LITLTVSHRLTLTLAELPQHLKVNTVIAEFLFHRQSVVLGAKLVQAECIEELYPIIMRYQEIVVLSRSLSLSLVVQGRS